MVCLIEHGPLVPCGRGDHQVLVLDHLLHRSPLNWNVKSESLLLRFKDGGGVVQW